MPPPEFLDCELYLTGYDQARFSVAGREYSGRPVLDEALQNRLLRAALDPAQYGKYLFDALFPGGEDDLLAGYREALAIARHEEKRLRFRLHVATTAPAKLHELRWEFLYDTKKKIALGHARETTFSRYLSVGDKPRAAVAEKPRILVVISIPSNASKYSLPELDREEIRQSIVKSLTSLDDLASYEILDPPSTVSRICDRLAGGEFHVLHLQAHGLVRSDQKCASLVLEDEDMRADLIDESRFSEIFEGERALRLVTLMACHSGSQTTEAPFSGLGPTLVERGIPAVVAMRRAISVNAAALFTEHFFRNLARSGHVDAAANEARRQLKLSARDDLEWGTPALFMRLADGLLWEAPPKQERPERAKSAMTADEAIWEGLLPWIDTDDFIPVLGPGVTRGLLPSCEEVAATWAARYGYPLERACNLPRVAQYVEIKVGRNIPHQQLPRLLTQELLDREQVNEQKKLKRLGLTEVIDKIAFRYFDRDDHEPHRVLAELPLSTYVTTNYDSFLAAALHWKGKEPLRKSCIWKHDLKELSAIEEYDDLDGTPEKPLVFHLYGNDLSPSSQVLTEDDYFDFLGDLARDFKRKIPPALRGGLSASMLLFLGYDVTALDCRVLFRGLVAQLREPQRERIAVLQLEGGDRDEKRRAELKHFMEKYCENIRIHVYWGTVRDFLTELYERWKADYGDL